MRWVRRLRQYHSSVDPDHPRMRGHHRRVLNKYISKKKWSNLGFVLSKHAPYVLLRNFDLSIRTFATNPDIFFYQTSYFFFSSFSSTFTSICNPKSSNKITIIIASSSTVNWRTNQVCYIFFLSILLDYITVLICPHGREGLVNLESCEEI